MVIIDSIRLMASRGELACRVPIEPSWPVFMACSRSKASGPRTSPTMIRSGRMRRPSLTRPRMRLLQLKLRRVLAGDDPLGRVDEGGQGVEQRRLARARTARDDQVATRRADDAEDARALRTDGAELHQVLHRQLVFLELPDR